MTSVVAAVLAVVLLTDAKPRPAQGARPDETDRVISTSLARWETAPITLFDVTRERRGAHRVACGFYRRREPQGSPEHPFGWVDGKLVMRFGPVWNPATLCLIKNYHMPLP